MFGNFRDSGDEALVAAARRGEQAAFAALFERHSARLWGFACSLAGGDLDEAQDLLQETFIRAFDRLDALEEARSLRSWLAATLKNVAFGRRETRNRREGLLAREEGAGVFAEAVPTPDDALVSRQTRQDLAAAAGRLTAESRRVFDAFHLEGRSIAEISEETGITVGAVKARLFHSRQKIKQELERMMPEKAMPGAMPEKLSINIMGEHEHDKDPLHPVRLTDKLLARHVLYACRKRPLDAGQIAQALHVDRAYIEDLLPDLVRGELMEEPLPGHYQTAFLVIEKEELERVMRGLSLMDEARPILQKHLPALQEALARTDLCRRQGYDWEELAWIALPSWIMGRGLVRQLNRLTEWGKHRIWRMPIRPVDNWYALGLGGLRLSDVAAFDCNSEETDRGGMGHVSVLALSRGHERMIDTSAQDRFVGGLLRGPNSEDALLEDSKWPDEDRDKLAGYVEKGYVRRLVDGRFELAVPVVGPEDDEMLAPIVDRVCGDLATDMLDRALNAFVDRVDEEGFGHLVPQPHYLGFVGFGLVASNVVLGCMKNGLLNEPEGERPKLGYWAWRGGRLMKGWGVGR